MKKLLIKTAFMNALQEYKKNFFSLAPFGIFMGLITWITTSLPGIITNLLAHRFMQDSAGYSYQSQLWLLSVYNIISKYSSMPDILIPILGALFSIIFTIIYTFVYFAFLKNILNGNIYGLSIISLFMWDKNIVKTSIAVSIGTALMASPFLLFLTPFFLSTHRLLYTFLFSTTMILFIIFCIRLCFYSLFMLDKNIALTEALKQSWIATQGKVLKILLLTLLLGLSLSVVLGSLSIILTMTIGTTQASFITMIAPSFFTIPFVALLLTEAYKQLAQ